MYVHNYVCDRVDVREERSSMGIVHLLSFVVLIPGAVILLRGRVCSQSRGPCPAFCLAGAKIRANRMMAP